MKSPSITHFIYTSSPSAGGLQVIKPIKGGRLAVFENADGSARIGATCSGAVPVKELFADIADSMVAAGLALRLGSAPAIDVGKPYLVVSESRADLMQEAAVDRQLRLHMMQEIINNQDEELRARRQAEQRERLSVDHARHLLRASGDREIIGLAESTDPATIIHALVTIAVPRGILLREGKEHFERMQQRLEALEPVLAKLQLKETAAVQMLRQVCSILDNAHHVTAEAPGGSTPTTMDDWVIDWASAIAKDIHEFLGALPTKPKEDDAPNGGNGA